MSETRYPAVEESLIRERLQRWFSAPVKLASSSSYRREALETLGFQSVEAAPMPDEIETSVMHDLAGESLTHELSLDLRDDPTPLVCDVARAKVDYLLSHTPVTPNDFICAADTMPRFTRLVFNAAGECIGARAEYLKKPETEAVVYQNLVSMFDSIIEAYHFINSGMLEQNEALVASGDPQKAIRLTSLAVKAMNIELGTGVAIRLPHSTQVDAFYSAMYLMPGRLRDIVEGKSQMKTTDLSEAVLFVMDQSGKSVTKIGGGIDYANTEVRMILDAHPAYNIRPEKGVYLGMPIEALELFLRDKASQSFLRTE